MGRQVISVTLNPVPHHSQVHIGSVSRAVNQPLGRGFYVVLGYPCLNRCPYILVGISGRIVGYHVLSTAAVRRYVLRYP